MAIDNPPAPHTGAASIVPDDMRRLLRNAINRALSPDELLALVGLAAQLGHAAYCCEAYLLESGVVASCATCRRTEPQCVCPSGEVSP